jgi:hypothetical protein
MTETRSGSGLPLPLGGGGGGPSDNIPGQTSTTHARYTLARQLRWLADVPLGRAVLQ